MKVFTREYYDTLFYTNRYQEFQIDNRAEIYDNDLFKEIYNNKKQEYENDNLNENDFEAFYDDLYNSTCTEVINKIPINIRNKIADNRVFALRVISQEVYDMLKNYCIIKENEYNNKYDEYFNNYYKNIDNCSAKTQIALDFNIVDLYILSTEIIDFDFYITLLFGNPDSIRQNHVKLVFKNFTILEINGDLDKSWIMCKEVYFDNNKTEFHLLCDKSDAIILADEIEYIDL
jgi:hypothetical protein